ncbi:ABC transporter substrate-binding protein [Arthrobacter sp. H14-L1]|uniref:ABC transporter substrate-binding protein n=1 Tax=Arthrobacter sp. H14-L1 TaxID=2996697 RepID=UPI00226F289F|nr:ABC transporter substrate-binding protein [Arthrobacter sp. H14-L1]MCY0906117.1 ABC transporter substrate-binding protein [Arthrobacter sp. H14-L1]
MTKGRNGGSTAAPATALGAAVLAAALAITACSGPSGNARTASVGASGDGVLKVGLLLDNGGAQGFLNDSEQAAAKLAVNQISISGGFKGKPVELLPATPGADTTSQATTLAALKADVVIGPTDSANAAAAIGVLSTAKITLISPANTAPGLRDAASGGYYFRTQAAYTMQGQVLAKLAADIGPKIAVLHESGSYGAEISRAVTEALKRTGSVAAAGTHAGTDAVAVDAQANPGAEAETVREVKNAQADAVIVVARGGGQSLLAELANAGIPGSKLVLSDGATGNYGTGLASAALKGAKGILPGIFPTAEFQKQLLALTPGLKDMTFAAETYDAVILAALAATAADDDAGSSIAARLISVSGGSGVGDGGKAAAGTPCTGYPDCSELLARKQSIDYEGISGPINFDENGDITAANYVVYSYGADNRPAMSGTEKTTAP